MNDDAQQKELPERAPSLHRELSPEQAVCPIVGIGASAGGLEALTQLLEHVPATTGMAYVVVQHLEPTHASLLANLLTRTAHMTVREAQEGMVVVANQVYVIAPNTDLTLEKGRLKLVPQTKTAGQHLSIDTFFTSLANNTQHRAIGVLLSGTGSDGTRGLQAIKGQGGITLAQDAHTARYAAMPQSAIAAGYVDFIGSPDRLARELTKISLSLSVYQEQHAETGATTNEEGHQTPSFPQILRLLHRNIGIDFTLYKPKMLKRRVQRRMVLQQIASEAEYLAYLHEHQEEVAALSRDFLIGVTDFFRTPSPDLALRQTVFPRILAAQSPPKSLRIWVPGCSTGEEVYSLAISLQEFLTEQACPIPFQIFGTDLNETAIEQARKGVYAAGVLSSVSPERLQRYFLPVNGSFRISTALRECCVFARHNLLNDPPFSRIDLVSCQNVLIYLEPPAQQKLLQIFHYALSPHGFLWLGPSETLGTATDLFASVEGYLQLSRKKATRSRAPFAGPVSPAPRKELSPFSKEEHLMHPNERSQAFDVQETERLLLARYAPASVIIDAEMEILHFRGRTSPYVEPATGQASLNLFKMARESLVLELRTAISQARKSRQPVKKIGIPLQDQGIARTVTVEVIPLNSSAPDCSFLIVFSDDPALAPHSPGTLPRATAPRGAKDRRIQQLERELESTRQEMRALLEEMEASQEEIQSSNEEILSSNEELRSLNEELETSKEEIQASNEELLVLNQELRQRNIQLHAAREYADAIVETIREPLLVLDADLRVQHANPAFAQFFQVTPAEIEHHLLFELDNQQWDIPALRTLLEDLLPTNHALTDYTMESPFPRIGRKTLLLNAQRIDHIPLILLAMEDITTLTQAVQEKQQLLEQREDFMAIASHELKTPLTSLKGYTQLLHSRFSKAGDVQAATQLARMDERINTLIHLINELLDVTRIQAGHLQWKTTQFDLHALIRDIVEEYGHTAELHQIQIEGDTAVLVAGDVEHVGQVLINLLTNALKYSPPATVVLITLQRERDIVIISMQDFGIGIPREKQAHLFERFFRVSEPAQMQVPGLGLGLYISAEIVKRLGGRIWVESSPGTGSTFFFTLPLVSAQNPGMSGEEGEVVSLP
jgi:two-component system CheB/CheR fusion protein